MPLHVPSWDPPLGCGVHLGAWSATKEAVAEHTELGAHMKALPPKPERKGPRICEPGGHGLIVPLGGEPEQHWDPRIRGFLYIVALVYCFLGVSIVADMFMGAIESITSKKQRVYMKATGRFITVAVWNDTVANLTLLALGSSAPEILLSGVEIVRNEFFSGELGPSTIVGSAAFNLLVIIAVCNFAIPSPERRRIRDTAVFHITAFFSLFAYLWLVFIVQVSSKDIIEVWEAVVTFIFFPVLVLISYAVDVGLLSSDKKAADRGRGKTGLASVVKVEIVDSDHNRNSTNSRTHQSTSSGFVRDSLCSSATSRTMASATPSALGGTTPAVSTPTASASMTSSCVVPVVPPISTPVTSGTLPGVLNLPGNEETLSNCSGPTVTSSLSNVEHRLSSRQRAARRSDAIHMLTGAKRARSEIVPGQGATLSPFRSSRNRLSSPSRAGSFRTVQGSSRNTVDSVRNDLNEVPSPSKSVPVVKTLSFDVTGKSASMGMHSRFSDASDATGFTEKSWDVYRSGSAQTTPRNTSMKHHRSSKSHKSSMKQDQPALLDASGQVIQNPSGVLTFENDEMEVLVGGDSTVLPVPVYRRNGTQGSVACRWFTDKLTALPGFDYEEDEGEVVFAPGCNCAEIPLTILPKRPSERSDEFQVVIDSATGGAIFNPNADGGDEANILTIKLRSETSAHASRTMRFVEGVLDVDAIRHGSSSWYAQIKESIFVNGSYEEQSQASAADWIMHVTAFPWKFWYSLTVPPTEYWNGWICFLLSLIHIGLLTTVIIEITELFGCVANIEDSTMAITFVALGTSIPDLFASKTAAIQDACADASIVNVTGSNSVNVFLGIGLPWTMASIHWTQTGPNEEWKRRYPGMADEWPKGAFVVEARGLSFSVTVFTIAAFIWLVVMAFRRRALGGELGGPLGAKVFTSILLILLWIFYIMLSIWKAKTDTDSTAAEVFAVLFGIATLTGIVIALGLGINLFGSCCSSILGPVFSSDRGKQTPSEAASPPPPQPFESWGVQPPSGLVPIRPPGGVAEISDQQPMDSTRVLNVLRQLRRDQVHLYESVARWNNVLSTLHQAIRGDPALSAEERSQEVPSSTTDECHNRHSEGRDNIMPLPQGMGGMKLVVEEEVVNDEACGSVSSQPMSPDRTQTRTVSDGSNASASIRKLEVGHVNRNGTRPPPGPPSPEPKSSQSGSWHRPQAPQSAPPPFSDTTVDILPSSAVNGSLPRDGLESRDVHEVRSRPDGLQESSTSCRVINM